MTANNPQTISVTTKNTCSLTLGLIAVIIGTISLLVGWVPYLGLLAIPFAGIGLLLAGLGFFYAIAKGFRGSAMPILGGLICAAGITLPILSTTATSAAITKATPLMLQAMTNSQPMGTITTSQPSNVNAGR